MDSGLIAKISLVLKEKYHGDTESFLHDLKKELQQLQNSSKPTKSPKQNSKEIIKITKLNKFYKKGSENLHVLKDLDLSINEGEIIALIGPSGSGKSTLLNLIGGLDTPNNGEILVEEKNLGKMNDNELSSFRNRTIGFVFQFFNLQPYLNVQENVEIPLMFRGEDENIREESSAKSVESVGLLDRNNHLPSELSGGQMQRVAIARSLVNNPKIILADEPTGNLDRKTGIEIINLLKEINEKLGTTIIIVTHDNFIANQADRVIKMDDGRIN
jgi:putative ABC transport system ATP-binding protein